MKKIIIFLRHYIPSIQSGGPVRSIENIVKKFKNNFNIFIVCLDRDVLDNKPFYENRNCFQNISGANVLYVNEKNINILFYRKLILKLKPDLIYLNSFFEIKFSFIPFIVNKTLFSKKHKVLMAPRGELCKAPLKIKSFRKHIYLFFLKNFLIDKNFYWHATSLEEKKDIKRNFKNISKIYIANNINTSPSQKAKHLSKGNILKLIYLSRIDNDKNLIYVVKLLSQLDFKVIFNIAGPIRNRIYFEHCISELEKTPPNINWSYLGEINRDNIYKVLSSNHLFILPTVGENFGHAIAESMSVGTPVLISNKSGFRDIEKNKAGWDFSLTDKSKFVNALKNVYLMDNLDYLDLRQSTRAYYEKLNLEKRSTQEHKQMFEKLI